MLNIDKNITAEVSENPDKTIDQNFDEIGAKILSEVVHDEQK